MYKYIFTYLFLLLCGFSNAQEISASASTDTSQIVLGDNFQYEIRVTAPKEQKVHFPSVVSLFQKDTFEVIKETSVDTLLSTDKILLSKKYTLTSYYPGQYSIKGVTLSTLNKLQEPIKISVPSTPMTVVGLQTKPQVIAPVKPIEKTAFKKSYLTEIIYIALGVLFVGILSLLAWKLLNRKKTPLEEVKEELIPEPIIPPYEQAMTALKQLQSKNLLAQGAVKEFQSELSFILRRYIENQFGVPALEMTTTESVRALQKHGQLNRHAPALNNIFTIADMVKFAKAEPTDEVNKQLFTEANAFVLSTKPNETTAHDV